LVDFGLFVVAGREVVCGSELAPVTTDWCSESLIEVPVMLGLGWLAGETSMFSLSETEFGRISWLCT
jgi:hypothetical protein